MLSLLSKYAVLFYTLIYLPGTRIYSQAMRKGWIRDMDKAKEIVNSVIGCINGIERYHRVNLKHAATNRYVTGFTEWTKTRGHVGKKVLLRSYHEPYG